MKRFIAVLLYLVLAVLPAYSTTVTANLRDLSGTAITSSAYVTFDLVNTGTAIPRVNGTNIIVPKTYTAKPDGSGDISVTIQDNSTITPAGTYYRVCVYGNGQKLRCDYYTITGTSVNLSTLTPNNPTVVTPPSTADATYLRLDAGNTNLTGTSGFAFGIINEVRYANHFAGADAGEKIAAAIASLPSTGGVVDARGLTGTQSAGSNPLVGGKANVTLLLGAATITTTVPWVATGENLHIVGTHYGSTIIKADGAVSCLFDSGDITRAFLDQLKFDGSGTALKGVCLGTGAAAQQMRVRDVWIERIAGTGLQLGVSGDNRVIDSLFDHVWIGDASPLDMTIGIYIAEESENNIFLDCAIGHATVAGLEAVGGTARFVSGVFSGNETDIKLSGPLSNYSFHGTWFENSIDGLVAVNGGYSFGNLTFSACNLHTFNATHLIDLTGINAASQLSILSCNINDISGSGDILANYPVRVSLRDVISAAPVGTTGTGAFYVQNGPFVQGNHSLYFNGRTNSGEPGMRFYYDDDQSYTGGSLNVVTAHPTTNGLIFRVDNNVASTERMRIGGNGNVGVGEFYLTGGNPPDKFDVMGDLGIGVQTNSANRIVLQSGTPTGTRNWAIPDLSATVLGSQAVGIGDGANANIQAPALGTGTGPSGSTVVKWIKVRASDGNDYWIPGCQ